MKGPQFALPWLRSFFEHIYEGAAYMVTLVVFHLGEYGVLAFALETYIMEIAQKYEFPDEEVVERCY